eukprot:CAMPEP_0119300222 /NCGR_PEP_ID=MMETSP1333-20130426/2203_1 /TAXON_ID=418940 /ORGANISM="Scyphosphaera apsteinii, Strain RCC1455" /LENGTH=537 /DNA_ID=CAMNT_0007301921 /DNA_START=199 /DNA_END=1809 /DNA_ORIENTATION=+
MAPKKIKKELFPCLVYTRIRPMSDGKSDGHGDGDAVDKQYAGFDAKAMLIKDRKGVVEKFPFPQEVFGPESTQERVYQSTMNGLLDGFLAGENNALLFAYGQTGTGKTHTMFGPTESLSSATPHPEWGLLPRIVSATLMHMAEQSGKKAMRLTISAVEFYSFGAWDLNAKKRHMCTITPDGDIFGHTFTLVTAVGDIAPFIERVYSNRKVNATKMNAGSSRSHVSIILTLYQVEMASGLFTQTEFNVVDLAGSERPGKTGADRVNGFEVQGMAMKALETGKELPIAAQGWLINFELTMLTTAFALATDAWSTGSKYKPQTAMVPPAVWALGSSATGHARIGIVVCISQSPQNGWETWFSCTWGQNAAKLKAPCNKQKPVDIDKELKRAQKDAKAADDAVKNQGSSVSAMKFAMLKVGMQAYTAERAANIEALVAMRSSGSGEATPVLAGDNDKSLTRQMTPCGLEIASYALREAFAEFDKNGDGAIDEDELISILMRGVGENVVTSEEEAKKKVRPIMKEFDTNKDNKLQVAEFIEW